LLVGLVVKQRMQRVESNPGSPLVGSNLYEFGQIRKVAHAPVAFGAHTVKLHGQCP
jgi:hypothetical protein